MRHSQRREDLLANGAFPTEAGELSFEVAHGHDREIVVLVGAAKAFVGLEIADAADQVLTAEVRGIPDEVVARESGAMREKVARSGLLARDGIVHLKFGKIAADRLVPIHFAFVFENGKGESREGFGDGADREKRGGGDRKLVLHVAISIALGVDDYSILHHGDGYARNFPLLHGVAG